MMNLLRHAAPMALAAACLAAPGAFAASPGRVVLPDDVVPSAYRIAITPHLESATFDGTVSIDIDVRHATRRLVLDSADLAIDHARLAGESAAPAITVDAARQTATFAFAHALSAGHHVLEIDYRGHIADQAQGLFRLKYATPHGEATALFTQFEDSDARRFVPCWDEPASKAVFDLTATVPADRMAVGNMPIASTETLAGDMKRVHFATTPKMSTYLLFFGLGDFERVHRDVDGVDIGVIVPRGDTASAAYALDAAATILPFYDRYFGTPYPLPKMDMIAGPGESISFGAMENWGALFYFERDLMVDPKRATEESRQRVFITVAHEMAHQWFGDLVTMAWWDDLWLNEGFASWMQVKAANELHPEWHAWLQTAAGKQRAMGTDARPGTHPVITHIDDITQASGAFDDITYDKGQQVIRTLESWMGEDAFRAGVRRYMQRHAYGNTVTDDFWAAMDDGAAQPVAPIARDLTTQPGVPLVTELDATCADGRTTLTLSQGEFTGSPGAAPARRWHVPVTVAALDGGSARIVVSGPAPQRVSVTGCGPVVINAGQTAWFRSRYTAAGFAALGSNFARLGPADQLGFLNDAIALAQRGDLAMSALAGLLRQVPADADPVVLETLVEELVDLDRLHDGLPTQPAFRAFARSLANPVFARLGWSAAAADDANTRKLRTEVIEALGRFDDAAVVAQAHAEFQRWRDAPDAPDALAGERRQAVLHVVAVDADDATWDTLHDLARTSTDALEQGELYQLLAIARAPALADRALALAVSDEPPISQSGSMLRAAAGPHPARTLAFMAQHWPAVEARLGAEAGPEIVSRFLREAGDPATSAVLATFGAAHVPATRRRGLVKAQALVGERVQVRLHRLPELDRWIASTTSR